MHDFDTIILGCGTMGAAAAWKLCNAGHRVLALDQFDPPHDQGSHHGHVRMFRMSYFEDRAYVPWLARSLEDWRTLSRESGGPVIGLVGALYMGLPDSPLIAGSLRSIQKNKLAHELLSHAQLAGRFPMFHLPRGMIGVLDIEAGFIYCEDAIVSMIHAAAAAGEGRFTPHNQQRVEGWTADNSGVEVRTAHAAYRAANLIITAGPWTAPILKDLDLPLTVTRQVQGWLKPAAPYYSKLPCWGIDLGDGTLFYGFPSLDQPDGSGYWLKLARHAPGDGTTAEAISRQAQQGDAEDFLPLAREYLPDLANAPCRTATCMYTNSPDCHFIIDRHPRHNNVAFACGFSGHGFKLAPAVGEILASLIATNPPHHPEPLFALGRFA